MEGSFRFRGPLPGRRWRRLLRRLSETATAKTAAAAVAGGTIYVAAAVEPNLSGVWMLDDGRAVRLFHVGRHVTAVFDRSGVVTFAAVTGERGAMTGYVNLYWQDEDMRAACGSGAMRDDTFRATVSADEDRITFRWTRRLGDQETCAITSTERVTSTLRRQRFPTGEDT